jgi:hypothetical protein
MPEQLRVDQLEDAPDHLLKRPEKDHHYLSPPGKSELDDHYTWPRDDEKIHEKPKTEKPIVGRGRPKRKSAAGSVEKGKDPTVCLQCSPSPSRTKRFLFRLYI